MCSPEARVKTEFEVEVWWSDVSDFLTQLNESIHILK